VWRGTDDAYGSCANGHCVADVERRHLPKDGCQQPLASDSYDFVFSFIVFQHVPSLAIIGSYCRDAHRILKPGGLFKFQVQGRTTFRRGRRDTWTGYQVSPSQARKLARGAGFVMEHSEGRGTQYYWLWFRKPPA
jgi:SAM-dependent methyltransferase